MNKDLLGDARIVNRYSTPGNDFENIIQNYMSVF